MKQRKLARKLKAMYDIGASKDETVAHIILFGIKYAEELNAAKQAGCSIWKIIKSSGIKKSQRLKKHTYTSEINYGMTLAQYVELKQ